MDFQNHNHTQNQMPYDSQGGVNPQNNMPYPVPPVARRENSMATAAMITAVIGVISLFVVPVYLPCIFAGISMVLALLSRGSSNTPSPYAKAALITSSCSLVLNIVILIFSFYLVFNVPEYNEQFNQLYEQMYGESFDDALKDSFWSE